MLNHNYKMVRLKQLIVKMYSIRIVIIDMFDGRGKKTVENCLHRCDKNLLAECILETVIFYDSSR